MKRTRPFQARCFATIIATILLAGSAWAASEQRGDDDSRPDLATRVADLREQLDKYHEGLIAGKLCEPDYTQLDRAIREAVQRAFVQGLSFSQVQEALGDLVRWQAMPDVFRVGTVGPEPPNSEKRFTIPGLARSVHCGKVSALPDKRPVVLYTTANTPSGCELYVFQNSILHVDNVAFPWQRWGVYGVLKSPDNIWTGLLFGESTYYGVGGEGLFVVGTMGNAQGVPFVILVKGPQANVAFLEVSILEYCQDARKWTCPSIMEFEHVRMWEYDDSNDSLLVLYSNRHPDEELADKTETYNPRARVEEALSKATATTKQAAEDPTATAAGGQTGTAPHGSRLAGQLAELAEAKRAWNADWCEAVDANTWDAQYEEFGRRVFEQDALLHKVLGTACREHASFGEIRKRLVGHIDFVDLPAEYAQSGAARKPLRRAKTPLTKDTDAGRVPSVVYVQKVGAPRGGVFHLLHTTHQRGGSLATTSFGLIAARGGPLTYHRLPSVEPAPDVGALHMRQVWGMALFLSNDAWPDVFFVEGPAGSGSFCFVHGATYDTANGTWTKPKPGHQFNGGRWKIDEDAGILKYARSTKGDAPGGGSYVHPGGNYIDLRGLLGMAGR